MNWRWRQALEAELEREIPSHLDVETSKKPAAFALDIH
jgi:hypothetical protein